MFVLRELLCVWVSLCVWGGWGEGRAGYPTSSIEDFEKELENFIAVRSDNGHVVEWHHHGQKWRVTDMWGAPDGEGYYYCYVLLV